MKFLKPSWPKIGLAFLLFIILAFVAMEFGTRAFQYSDEQNSATAPIHFQLNPILWLPSYLILHGEVVDFTIVKGFLYALPYWLIISYLISCVIFHYVKPKRRLPTSHF